MVQYMDNNNSGFNMWNANKNAQTRKSGGFLRWLLILIAAWWLVGIFMAPQTPTETVTESITTEDLSNVPVNEFNSDKLNASIQGLRISDIVLKEYPVSSESSDSVALLNADNNFIEVGLLSTGSASPTSATVWQTDGDSYIWSNSDGVQFVRDITSDNYVITVRDTITNKSGNTVSYAPYARIVRDLGAKTNNGGTNGAIAYVNSDVEDMAWHKLDKKSFAYSTTNGFAGFTDQYWATIASVDSPDQTIRIKKTGDKYSADVAASAVSVAPGATATITTNVFTGPRDQDILNAAESRISGLGEIIDYGWFWFLARPMLWILNGIHHIVMNYGVAIIIMTILLRLLMWPLTLKSYTNMAIMQQMQPEMQRIQRLYANDKMRLQMEMMKLYQTHKTSPMAGCLPMLIQIPIFFALYKALLVSVAMRNAHFLWIHDLSAMDPYFILPILMGATMFLQQRLQSSKQVSSTSNDAVAQTQKMMQWMPVLFTIMFAWMPAGLVLYWTVSNVFGIIQMQIIKKQSK